MLGTAGGLYHFRDQIRMGNPDAFFVMNGDVCADFPLQQLYQFHKDQPTRYNLKALVTTSVCIKSLFKKKIIILNFLC